MHFVLSVLSPYNVAAVKRIMLSRVCEVKAISSIVSVWIVA